MTVHDANDTNDGNGDNDYRVRYDYKVVWNMIQIKFMLIIIVITK